MTKKELIAKIAEETKLPQYTVSSVVENTIKQISSLLSRGDKIALSGFGIFSTRNKAQMNGRNPQTGKSIVIPSHKVVKFKAAKKLKETINDN